MGSGSGSQPFGPFASGETYNAGRPTMPTTLEIVAVLDQLDNRAEDKLVSAAGHTMAVANLYSYFSEHWPQIRRVLVNSEVKD